MTGVLLTGWISLCCGEQAIQHGGDGTPRWCACQACGMPCVPVERKVAFDEERNG